MAAAAGFCRLDKLSLMTLTQRASLNQVKKNKKKNSHTAESTCQRAARQQHRLLASVWCWREIAAFPLNFLLQEIVSLPKVFFHAAVSGHLHIYSRPYYIYLPLNMQVIPPS